MESETSTNVPPVSVMIYWKWQFPLLGCGIYQVNGDFYVTFFLSYGYALHTLAHTQNIMWVPTWTDIKFIAG